MTELEKNTERPELNTVGTTALVAAAILKEKFSTSPNYDTKIQWPTGSSAEAGGLKPKTPSAAAPEDPSRDPRPARPEIPNQDHLRDPRPDHPEGNSVSAPETHNETPIGLDPKPQVPPSGDSPSVGADAVRGAGVGAVAGTSSSGSDSIVRDERPSTPKDNSGYRPGCQEDEKGSLNVYAGGSKCFDEAAGSNTIVLPKGLDK
jgi:hypothetical protein